jgi:Spy/CpxP family protein refolding chaperone
MDVKENEKQFRQEVTMTKMRSILIVAVLVLLSLDLMAGPAGRGRDMMKHTRYGIHMAENNLFPGYILLKYKDEIGLTEDQVSKIDKIRDLFQETKIKKHADIKIKELKLRSYLEEKQLDRKQMEKKIWEIAKMKTEMQIDQMNYLLDLKDLLSPKQLEKIESLKKERRERMMERRKFRKDRERERTERKRTPRRLSDAKDKE